MWYTYFPHYIQLHSVMWYIPYVQKFGNVIHTPKSKNSVMWYILYPMSKNSEMWYIPYVQKFGNVDIHNSYNLVPVSVLLSVSVQECVHLDCTMYILYIRIYIFFIFYPSLSFRTSFYWSLFLATAYFFFYVSITLISLFYV